jgi:two-component system CheB/CheR fusion protein
VGVGASAGGLEALEQLFSNLPADSGMGFVVVTHLDPSHKSMMSELLARVTRMHVVEAKDGMVVEPNRVHVIPPDRDMAITNGMLRLSRFEEPRGLRMPIDFFFRSLAKDQRDGSLCIILSGSGTDGTMGLKAIHEAGGMSMVQDPTEAKYEGMPQSAINTGIADYVLPVAKMPGQLLAYVKRTVRQVMKRRAVISEKAPKSIERILSLLRSQTGHDFAYYKKSTLLRRIERRMTVHDVGDPATYVHYLQGHPQEVRLLLKELLISVTSFFRDPAAFDILRTKVLPLILEGRPEDYALRIWVPGCATGEEAYSIAMVVREYLDEQKSVARFQIFGTDIDEAAINVARAGVYSGNIGIDVSPERLRRFFIKEENTFRIKKGIRETIVFAVQNVITDAPFTRLDLLSCRNLLIYLEPELQNKLMPLFHYSLRFEGGVLFLGSSESIGSFSDLFKTVDRKWKFFQRKGPAFAHAATAFTGLPWTYEHGVKEAAPEIRKQTEVSVGDMTRNLLLDRFTPPCVITNEKGEIVYVHGRTGKYLEPAPGQANLNILEMAREGIAFELRSALHNAVRQHKVVSYKDLHVKTNGDVQSINLTVQPINEPDAMQGLLMVVFEDVMPKREERAKERQKSRHGYGKRVHELEQELRYSKENLQATIEELQATNEELKSSNEELQSTNEELQSTNEELETSKEELQSLNEELVTVNSELQAKIDQLSRTENDMKNLLDSTNIGTIFLDNDLRIKRFTPEATKVVNLIPGDVGRPISDIVSNLRYENLLQDARAVLDTLSFREVQVQTKDGTWYGMRVMPYRTFDNVIDGVVITVTNIDAMRRSIESVTRAPG